jgi:hypothetical protein
MDNKNKICKHYVMGNCKNGDSCTYKHQDNICRDFFKGDCKRDNCKFTHISNANPKNNKQNHKRTSPYGIKKNTESFEPWFNPADIRIMLGDGKKENYTNEIQSRDVILIPNLFEDLGDVYNKIIDEVDAIKNTKIWKPWHGDTHLIADDHEVWKVHSPTFNKVIDRIKVYFNMDIKATRLNWYDANEFKPKHHDAAAIDEKKAKVQNLTVGVSFGETRSVEFEHAKTRTTINVNLPNGYTYTFSKDVNIQWRHGIPPLPKEQVEESGCRISIIAWGYAPQVDI